MFSWRNIFAYLIMAIVATQILFPLKSNIIYSNIFIYVFLLLFVIFALLHKDYKYKYNFFIFFYGLFALVCFSSLMWTIDLNFSLPIVMRILLLEIMLFAMFNVIKEFDIKLYLIYGILIGAGFNFLLALNLLNYTTEFTNPTRFTGTLARSNDVAIVMIIAIFAVIMLKYEKTNKYIRFFSFISIPLSLYTILLTVSKKGILFGMLLSIIYFSSYLKNLKKMIFIFPLLALIMYFMFQSNSDVLGNKIERLVDRASEFSSAIEGKDNFGSTGERLLFIEKGKEYFSNNPILGTGINTFMVMNPTKHYSHNNYIEIIVGIGLVGFFSYYLIYIVMFLKIFKNRNRNKNVLIFTSMIFLVMDTALVSYSYKIVIIALLLMSIYVDEDKKISNE